MFKNFNFRRQQQPHPIPPAQQMEQFYMNQYMQHQPMQQPSPPNNESFLRRSNPNPMPNPQSAMGQHLLNLEQRVSQLERQLNAAQTQLSSTPSQSFFQSVKRESWPEDRSK